MLNSLDPGSLQPIDILPELAIPFPHFLSDKDPKLGSPYMAQISPAVPYTDANIVNDQECIVWDCLALADPFQVSGYLGLEGDYEEGVGAEGEDVEDWDEDVEE